MSHARFPHAFSAALCGVALLAGSTTPASAQEESRDTVSAQTFAYRTNDGDGRSIELRIEDGRVVTARVDGRDLPTSRVRKVRGGYELLDADGRVIRHIGVVHAGEVDAGADAAMEAAMEVHARRGQGDARGMERPRVEVRDRVVVGGAAGGRAIGGRSAMQWTAADAPKSMIGAGLGAPDEAVAHHLDIDRAKSTMVTSVVDGLPADAAGIERFDVIVSVNGDGDASAENIRRALRDTEPGGVVVLELRRGEKTVRCEVKAVAFDASRLEPLAVEGMPLEFEDMSAMFDGDGEGEGVMLFVDPQGRRREIRVPGMTGMPVMPGMPLGFATERMEAERMEAFERAMQEMNRRMEEMARRVEERMERQMEERMRERMPGAGPERAEPRGPQGDRTSEDRVRRMEERIEQLRRELERERTRGNDA